MSVFNGQKSVVSFVGVYYRIGNEQAEGVKMGFKLIYIILGAFSFAHASVAQSNNQNYKSIVTSGIDHNLISSNDPSVVATIEVCSPLQSSLFINYASYDYLQTKWIEGKVTIPSTTCSVIIGSKIWAPASQQVKGAQYRYLGTTVKRP